MSKSRVRQWTSVIATFSVAISLGTACGAPSSVNNAGAVSLETQAPCVSGTCHVAVNVATLWVRPWYPRAVDEPALGNPAQPRRWLSTMTGAQRAWLVGKLETQAVYGTRVRVVGHWRGWAHVTVPGQPTNRDPGGYPGWVPDVQLTRTAPASASSQAVVRARTAWLWSRWSAGGVSGAKLMLASYDTRFPVVRATRRYVEVTLIGGEWVALRRSDVVVHQRSAEWGASRAKITAEARRFLGLPYLWAGTSGLGYDCSGLVYAVYHTYGLTLARDADQQAARGAVVRRSALRPGDLVFFRGYAAGPISHVGIYVGAGNMIDAPHTGAAIRVESVRSFSGYAGARRYLTH